MPKTTKRVTKKSKPITIVLRVAGQDQTIQTDNVLNSLRELSINTKLIKSRVEAYFTYEGKTLRRLYGIAQFRRLVLRDLNRQVVAKYVNTALGIPVTNYT